MTRRDHRIDLLRGLAIFSVLLLHFDLSYRLTQDFSGLAGRMIHTAIRNGNYGVVVFFVVSGYLITSTSLRRFGSLAQVSPRVFYSFRAARILPCLALALAIITPLGVAGIPSFRDTRHVPLWLADLSVLTFWHNVLMAKFGYFNYCLNIYWSLSVEEVFYLSFPLLCLLKRPKWIVPVWLLAITIGPIYRRLHSNDEILFLYGNLACFDALALGCLMALLARHVRIGARTRDIVQICALVFMAAIYVRGSIDATPVWGSTLMAAGAAAILLAEGAVALDSPPVKQRFRALASMGRHSYELYLFHIAVLGLMRDLVKSAGLNITAKLLWLVLFLCMSASLAAVIARYYSEPLNSRLRQYFVGYYRKRPVL
ncbi:MAG TPA: acyltransferase [Bryobacteraceae bacterium]|nr:acyltransferase [Bryobacteraceae bacterium]